MRATSTTERWADVFLGTPDDALPEDVVGQAKRALLDYFGVALAGAAMPMARIVADYYRDLGGRAEASVLLDDRPLPAVHAAAVNGVYGHALDMDDGHRLAAGHPGVATIPAALAAAEVRRLLDERQHAVVAHACALAGHPLGDATPSPGSPG